MNAASIRYTAGEAAYLGGYRRGTGQDDLDAEFQPHVGSTCAICEASREERFSADGRFGLLPSIAVAHEYFSLGQRCECCTAAL
jgi:hypothetical protein